MGSSYPILDPIQNLRVKIRLERVLSAAGGTLPSFSSFAYEGPTLGGSVDGGGGRRFQRRTDQEVEEYTFKWQEKVFSTKELRKYSVKENCKTSLEQAYHQKILDLREDESWEPTQRLFTYIDGDEFESLDESLSNLNVTEDEDTQNSFLAERMSNLKQRKVVPQSSAKFLAKKNPIVDVPSKEAILKAHTLPQSSATMRIMAYLGPKDSDSAPVVDSETEEPIPSKKQESDERIICTIRLINGKQLLISPDFSHSKKPYKVEGRIGVFQYMIKDVSAKPDSEALHMQRKAESKLSAYRSNMLKSRVGSEFDIPEDGVFKMVLLGEITTGKGFEYDDLYVHYLLELPQGWYPAGSPKALEGMSQICRSAPRGQEDIVHFNFPFELALCYNINPYDQEQETQIPKWPAILIEVGSLDSWNRHRLEGYGFTSLPATPGLHHSTVHSWRPVSNSSAGELRRFFIGGTSELESIDYARMPKRLEGTLVSKLGLTTVSSGSIDLRFHVMHQCRSLISEEKQRQMRYGSLLEKLGARGGMPPSILGILESFQKARQRMLVVRDNLLADQDLIDEN